MFAAPFNDETSQVFMNNETSIQKKKMAKTLKRYPPVEDNMQQVMPVSSPSDNSRKTVNFQKVNQVMQAMNNLPSYNDELGDFNPPPPPMSSGVQSTILRENMASLNEPEMAMPQISPTPAYNNNNASTNHHIAKIPNYNNLYGSTPYNTPTNKEKEQDALMEKVNYMIHLLEEQQDERTGNVMEEVILYSFLGVFIIFIVDSFCHVGKYTR